MMVDDRLGHAMPDGHEVVRRTLGQPFWERGGLSLYEGDCLGLMARLPDCVVPLCVSSPPYNIGKTYEQRRPMNEYLDWCQRWMTENLPHHY